MPAVIRILPSGEGGSIRLGPECFVWGDDYTHSLCIDEIVKPNIAVIGGLTWTLEGYEYRWLEAALIEKGLRAAIDRVIRGPDGKPMRDADGNPLFRRKMMRMPNWPRSKIPSTP